MYHVVNEIKSEIMNTLWQMQLEAYYEERAIHDHVDGIDITVYDFGKTQLFWLCDTVTEEEFITNTIERATSALVNALS